MKTKISEMLLCLAFKSAQVPVSSDLIDFLEKFPHSGVNRLRTLINVGYACLKCLEALGNSK